jgi:hypothetical protein
MLERELAMALADRAVLGTASEPVGAGLEQLVLAGFDGRQLRGPGLSRGGVGRCDPKTDERAQGPEGIVWRVWPGALARLRVEGREVPRDGVEMIVFERSGGEAAVGPFLVWQPPHMQCPVDDPAFTAHTLDTLGVPHERADAEDEVRCEDAAEPLFLLTGTSARLE